MVKEWLRYKPSEDPFGDNVAEELTAFLVSTGKPEAIRALSASFGTKPVGVRMTAISTLGRTQGSLSMFSTAPGGTLSPSEDVKPPSAEALEAMEDVLVFALDDTQENTGMSGTWGDKSFEDPRICDIAGHVLNQRFGERYPFDISVSLPKRESQRIVLKNIWRKKRSLPPLPLPKRRMVVPLSSDTLKPILTPIISGPTTAEAKEAVRQLEAIGLPALQGVLEAKQRLGREDPAADVLEGLANKLGRITAVIKTLPQPLDPGEPLAIVLRKLQNTPLSAESIVAILTAATNHLPNGAGGITLVVSRWDWLAGAELTIEVVASKADQEQPRRTWNSQSRVKIDGRSIHSSSSSMSIEHGKTEEAWEDLAKSISKALDTPPSTNLSVRVSVALNK